MLVHPVFERAWPLSADHLHELLKEEELDVEFVRLNAEDERCLSGLVSEPDSVDQLISLGAEMSQESINEFSNLNEAFLSTPSALYFGQSDAAEQFEQNGVTVHRHDTEGFWGQSVAEFALGLTISALRRIPHLHDRITRDLEPWDHEPDASADGPDGVQYADTHSHVGGTIAGKDVGIVGIGNIGSRYANVVDTLGGSVTAYDPMVDQTRFQLSNAERKRSAGAVISDVDIFSPMIPLTDATEEMITRDHVFSLPTGSLLVLVTRAEVCNMEAVRERVLNDEIALAADVWDREPLPLDDPILDKDNVVHTPHVAGRTEHANKQWAERIAEKFAFD